jgi:anthranilate synthase component I
MPGDGQKRQPSASSRRIPWQDRSMPERRLAGTARIDLIALHAQYPDRYPVLLESAALGARTGRYDLLLAGPGAALTLTADGSLSGTGGGGFLTALDRWWQAERVPASPGPPFSGGWFLYLGYELAGEIEPTLSLPRGTSAIACALRCHAALILDHEENQAWLVAEPGHEAILDRLEADLRSVPQVEPAPVARAELVEDPPDRYLRAVLRAKEHIAAGDIYQANLARGWRGHLPRGARAADLYRNLRRANPGPFAGIAALPGMTVLSTSPERLVQVRGDHAQTRPIAGTRPRVGDDAKTIAELTANAKERAEHVMLIDLERNDLGRVCRAGTVRVDEFCVVESYAHVHHLVSNVRGELRAGVTPADVIRALFPGGTITGCPKVRCMQIIAELEGEARGAYTGSMGYLDRSGDLDLNILIRTATVVGDRLEVRAGAGIVADSEPERELEETRAKALGLLRGLGVAS